MPVNIANIRPLKGTQHDAFEELVCQLVRRTCAAGSTSWRRLHGAGGDGGVEAYWHNAQKGKIGLQAKYFLKMADVQWDQIERSFETAIKIHRDLVEYRIFIACDLTGPTARAGKSGVEKWTICCERMLRSASTKQRKIKIELFTLSNILDLLAKPNCDGLAQLWFNEFEIASDRLRSWLNEAIGQLGERYHPEDHVTVSAQDVFLGTARDLSIINSINQLGSYAEQSAYLTIPDIWRNTSKAELVESANVQVAALGAIATAFNVPLDCPLPTNEWIETVKRAKHACQAVAHETYTGDSSRESSNDKEKLQYLRSKAYEKADIPEELEALLGNRQLKAEGARACVIIGPAGAGKSHLLAAAAQMELELGGTALLFLGHWFHSDHIWQEIAYRLDHLTLTKSQLLGALDSRAAYSQRRAIIIVDAINESHNIDWKRELHGLVKDILEFPNLSLVVSCRDVYEKYLIQESIYQSVLRIELHGFTSDEEQEAAARMYLDKRGIRRPPSPWLAPEFTNPLFLRTAANSLNRLGKREFPDGLVGTKEIFRFFLDATSETLGTVYNGSSELRTCVPRALRTLARAMAAASDDSLAVSEAFQILEATFEGYFSETKWLDLLCRNGLLDKYPDSEPDSNDPFAPPELRIRFVYQRLQDHLMAEALLDDSQGRIENLFAGKCVLNFMLGKNGHVDWRWSGLVEALSIQTPERFGIEFIDEVIKATNSRWPDYTLETSFIESVKWRAASAFTTRTQEIINILCEDRTSIFSLLLELTFRVNHPLNAYKLHEILSGMEFVERDQYWTNTISHEYDGSPYERLVKWCSETDKSQIDQVTLRMGASTLTWLLSSTARHLRDTATKALSSLFLDDPSLFPWLLARFENIDDPYILERLLAAGYGYLLRCGDSERYRQYSSAVAKSVFGSDTPIVHLHIRDYARSIIELANSVGAYVEPMPLAHCRPPYGSSPPAFDVTKKQIEAVAKKAGDSAILHSCEEWGDFGRYELGSEVGTFINFPLSKPIPTTPRQRAEKFESSLHDAHEAKPILCQLKSDKAHLELVSRMNSTHFSQAERKEISGDENKISEAELKRAIKDHLRQLKNIFSADKYIEFKTEWLPMFKMESWLVNQYPEIDLDAARRWVARRAYGLGWTAKRFPNDRGSRDYSRSRPMIERIGKKYQWIARSELLARLADNFWLKDRYSDDFPRPYNHPLDIGYERDIDASLFGHFSFESDKPVIEESFLTKRLHIDAREGKDRLAWPFEEGPAKEYLNQVTFKDNQGISWTRLAWHTFADRKRTGSSIAFHGFQQRVFYFIDTILIRPPDVQKVIAEIRAAGQIDSHRWKAADQTDHPFIYECGKSPIWPIVQRSNIQINWPEGSKFEIANAVEVYAWESHLDRSLPDGARIMTIAPWWMKKHDLHRSRTDPRNILDCSNSVVGLFVDFERQNSGMLVDTGLLQKLLEDENLEIISLVVGEREAWSDGAGAGAQAYRRFYGVMGGIGNAAKSTTWHEDRKG